MMMMMMTLLINGSCSSACLTIFTACLESISFVCKACFDSFSFARATLCIKRYRKTPRIGGKTRRRPPQSQGRRPTRRQDDQIKETVARRGEVPRICRSAPAWTPERPPLYLPRPPPLPPFPHNSTPPPSLRRRSPLSLPAPLPVRWGRDRSHGRRRRAGFRGGQRRRYSQFLDGIKKISTRFHQNK